MSFIFYLDQHIIYWGDIINIEYNVIDIIDINDGNKLKIIINEKLYKIMEFMKLYVNKDIQIYIVYQYDVQLVLGVDYE